MKKQKIIKFKDTFLTFYNYKEPLRKVKKGFGYQGVLLGTVDGTGLQCHICGKIFAGLSAHIRQAHKVSIPDYRKTFELAGSTRLVSESERQRLKMATLKWLQSMSKAEKDAFWANRMKSFRAWEKISAKERSRLMSHPHTLETKNKRGICPDQLLETIKEVKKSLGRTPSKKEFIDHWESQRYVHLIYKTFGSWEKAVKMAGLSLRKHTIIGGHKRRYSNEELLEYLQIFYKEERKIPTHTDCLRGIIPGYATYRRAFGSLPKAREAAGIYEKPTRWGTKSYER